MQMRPVDCRFSDEFAGGDSRFVGHDKRRQR